MTCSHCNSPVDSTQPFCPRCGTANAAAAPAAPYSPVAPADPHAGAAFPTHPVPFPPHAAPHAPSPGEPQQEGTGRALAALILTGLFGLIGAFIGWLITKGSSRFNAAVGSLALRFALSYVLYAMIAGAALAVAGMDPSSSSFNTAANVAPLIMLGLAVAMIVKMRQGELWAPPGTIGASKVIERHGATDTMPPGALHS